MGQGGFCVCVCVYGGVEAYIGCYPAGLVEDGANPLCLAGTL